MSGGGGDNAMKFLVDFYCSSIPKEMKLGSAQNLSRRLSRHVLSDILQLQLPNVMAFFSLQTFAP